MSKKTNTLLFILGATVFNVVLTVVFFLAFLLIYSRFLYGHLSENTAAWVLPVFFIAAIVVTFLVYRQAIKFLMKKVDMEKHFDPIFRSVRKPRP